MITCELIFHLVRKKHPRILDSDCYEAFDKIQRYLQNPSLIFPSIPQRPLILYLIVTETTLGFVLGQHDE